MEHAVEKGDGSGCKLSAVSIDAEALPKLPAAEFSYIGRPAETFEGRWKAIEEALAGRFGRSGARDTAFTLVDVGSNHGYFALNTALRFPASEVIGVEGSVGIGNGAVGSSTKDTSRIVATGAIRTHLDWVSKLGLTNCSVAPEVWDLDHVEHLEEEGFRADVMLTLSVVHHIDGICQAAYRRRGLDAVEVPSPPQQRWPTRRRSSAVPMLAMTPSPSCT